MSTLRSSLLFVLLIVGCARGRSEPKAPEAPPAPVAAEPATPPPPASAASADPTSTSAADLYGQCRSRVEGPESEGECASDSDCTKTGCSGEVCTTKDKAAGLMTTCEVLPCFQVLDTCGCVEGICSWALKDGPVPAGRKLPVQLPQ